MQADGDGGKAEEFKDAANALEHGLLETPNPSAEKEEIGGDADLSTTAWLLCMSMVSTPPYP